MSRLHMIRGVAGALLASATLLSLSACSPDPDPLLALVTEEGRPAQVAKRDRQRALSLDPGTTTRAALPAKCQKP
jgi:hypothetical protein